MNSIQLAFGILILCLASFALGVLFVKVYDDYTHRPKLSRAPEPEQIEIGVSISGVDDVMENLDTLEGRMDNLLEKSEALNEACENFRDGITDICAVRTGKKTHRLYVTNGKFIYFSDDDGKTWREAESAPRFGDMRALNDSDTKVWIQPDGPCGKPYPINFKE
jgi:hypothetical protein